MSPTKSADVAAIDGSGKVQQRSELDYREDLI